MARYNYAKELSLSLYPLTVTYTLYIMYTYFFGSILKKEELLSSALGFVRGGTPGTFFFFA